jgi:hypothetical protein
LQTELQSLAAILLISAALTAHVYARPFQVSQMVCALSILVIQFSFSMAQDKLEFFSLTMTFLTFYGGQLLYTSNEQ